MFFMVNLLVSDFFSVTEWLVAASEAPKLRGVDLESVSIAPVKISVSRPS